jgi:ATP-dependent HslUV protease subunit HslV
VTTIATDGKTIAADSLLTFGRERSLRPVDKILVRKRAIFAVAGLRVLDILADWYEAGARLDAVPKIESTDEWVMLVITREGMNYYHSRAPVPCPVSPPFAIGSGGEFAQGAMDAGASPERAVEIACRRSVESGPPIQVVDIAEALGLAKPKLEAAE